MPDLSPAQQLRAITIVEQLVDSVAHLHPSYTTMRVGLKWLRGHVGNRDRNRGIGIQFNTIVRSRDLDLTELTYEQIGDLIRDTLHAAGHVIEACPEPAREPDRA